MALKSKTPKKNRRTSMKPNLLHRILEKIFFLELTLHSETVGSLPRILLYLDCCSVQLRVQMAELLTHTHTHTHTSAVVYSRKSQNSITIMTHEHLQSSSLLLLLDAINKHANPGRYLNMPRFAIFHFTSK